MFGWSKERVNIEVNRYRATLAQRECVDVYFVN